MRQPRGRPLSHTLKIQVELNRGPAMGIVSRGFARVSRNDGLPPSCGFACPSPIRPSRTRVRITFPLAFLLEGQWQTTLTFNPSSPIGSAA